MNKTYQNILSKTAFNPPKDWLQIKTIDMHTGGEPLRVIVDGFPELKGNSVLEVIKSFEKVTGKKVNYKLVDRREGDITAAYADTNYANDELGWKTELSLDDALLSAWKWQETF